MRKIALLLAFALLIIFTIGCAKDKTESTGTVQGKTRKSLSAKDAPVTAIEESQTAEIEGSKIGETDSEGRLPTSGSKANYSYEKYLEAKSNLISRLNDAFAKEDDSFGVMMSFLSITAIDLAMWPAAFLGADEEMIRIGLGFLSEDEMEYEEKDGRAVATYTDNDGQEIVFAGEYDEDKDHYLFTSHTDGQDHIYAEYIRTSYGYAGQYYMVRPEDGAATVFLLTIDGDDGIVAFIDDADKPPPLSGQESFDFPKSAPEWYELRGNKISGIDNKGKTVDIVVD